MDIESHLGKPSRKLRALDLGAQNNSDRELRIMRGWLEECINEHSECRKLSPVSALPKRIINVTKDGDLVRLESTVRRQELRYCALSYCWGAELGFMTTKENLKMLESGFDISILPATIRDAIILTRKLQIPYIWVDSLCIVQNDKREWAREASKMAGIYGTSILTISPVGIERASLGFLGPRNGPSQHPEVTMKLSEDDVASATFIRVPTQGWSGFEGQPSQKRAWCFQERILSRRSIHFTKEQILYECRQLRACEDGQYEQIQSLGRGGGWLPLQLALKGATQTFSITKQSNIIYEAWRNLVSAYSSTHLTVPSDRLPALSGLAQFLQKRYKDRYLAGLWMKDLLNGLLWSVDHHRAKKNREGLRQQSVGQISVSPTWSWASHQEPVMWWSYTSKAYSDDGPEGVIGDLATVLKAQTTSLNSSKACGQVLSGSIKFNAPYACYSAPKLEEKGVPAANALLIRSTSSTATERSAYQQLPGRINASCNWDDPLMNMSRYLSKHGCCEIIGIGVEQDVDYEYNITLHGYALIVEKVPDRLEEYRRIGVIRLYEAVIEFQGRRTITLV